MTHPRFKPRFKILTAWRRPAALLRDERGVTAVEFGLLALPFFALVSAIMETAIIFLASNIFESALQDSSRLIRTGRAHQNNYAIEDFRGEICDRTYGLFDCSQIKLSVRTIDSFASMSITPPIAPDTAEWTLAEQYDPGSRKSIVVAEAYYKWETLLDIMGFNLMSSADGTVLMGTARVWRNEPF